MVYTKCNHLYANTHVRIEILSNGQNFNTHMRICILKLSIQDCIAIPAAGRYDSEISNKV